MEEYICDKCLSLYYSAKDSAEDNCDKCMGKLKPYDQYFNGLKQGITQLLCEDKASLDDVTELYLKYANPSVRRMFPKFSDKQYRVYVAQKVFEKIGNKADKAYKPKNLRLFE